MAYALLNGTRYSGELEPVEPNANWPFAESPTTGALGAFSINKTQTKQVWKNKFTVDEENIFRDTNCCEEKWEQRGSSTFDV